MKLNVEPNLGPRKLIVGPRKYVHHRKRGDVSFPGIKLKVLQRSLHLLKKRRIQTILGNKSNKPKSYYEKKLLKQIRPRKRERRVYLYKETRP
jgi:hypothetical protein